MMAPKIKRTLFEVKVRPAMVTQYTDLVKPQQRDYVERQCFELYINRLFGENFEEIE